MAYIGNSLAQGLISGANIQDGTVDTPDLKDSAVSTAKIADASITTQKFGSSANAPSASLIGLPSGTTINSSIASTWAPSPLTSQTFVWGQKFTKSSISSDTGDIVWYLRAGQYPAGGTELCVAIDGDFYSGGDSSGNTYRVLNTYNVGSYALPITGGSVTGQISALTFTNTFATAVTDYRTTSPNSTSILLQGSPNDRDCWVFRDPAGGSNNWGIYNRNVDASVGTVAENSIAFVGANVSRFSICLTDGSLTHQGLPAFTARAFANFVATGPTGTLSFRGSGNMSSVTDFGTYWTFNFATAMPDNGYAAVVSGEFGGSDTAFEVGAPTTSGFNLWASVGNSGGDSSPSTVSVIVVR